MCFAGIKELMREVKLTIKLAHDITAFLPEKAVLSAVEDLDHCLLIKCRDQHQTAQCFLQTSDLFKISDAVDQRLLQASETEPVSRILAIFLPFLTNSPTLTLQSKKPASADLITMISSSVITEDIYPL